MRFTGGAHYLGLAGILFLDRNIHLGALGALIRRRLRFGEQTNIGVRLSVLNSDGSDAQKLVIYLLPEVALRLAFLAAFVGMRRSSGRSNPTRIRGCLGASSAAGHRAFDDKMGKLGDGRQW
jgi:hypothetical protein